MESIEVGHVAQRAAREQGQRDPTTGSGTGHAGAICLAKELLEDTADEPLEARPYPLSSYTASLIWCVSANWESVDEESTSLLQGLVLGGWCGRWRLALSLSSSLCVFPHLHGSLVIFFSPVSPLPGVLDLAVPKVSIRAISPKELCGDSTQEKPNLSYFQAFTQWKLNLISNISGEEQRKKKFFEGRKWPIAREP